MNTRSEASPAAFSVRSVDWKAATLAGLIAGVVFMMAEMIMVAVFQGESPWGPPRMIAAMVMGPGVLAPATFDAGLMAIAMGLHLPLSIIYGLGLAVIVRRANAFTAVAVGALAGVAAYFVNFYPIADAWFPWFAMGRGWLNVVTHMLFGAIAGLAYTRLRRRKAPVTHSTAALRITNENP